MIKIRFNVFMNTIRFSFLQLTYNLKYISLTIHKKKKKLEPKKPMYSSTN